MSHRHQKGRKPQKSWHKNEARSKWRKVDRSWSEPVAEAVYDGAPTPLRGKSKGGKRVGQPRPTRE